MELATLILIVLLQIEFVAYVLKKSNYSKTKPGNSPTFIDTSVLIDGRIGLVAETGFVPANLIIPESVLHELQMLADGSDSEKRMRARHGLDVAKQLRELEFRAITVYDDGQATEGVDARLIELAKKFNGGICTIDFNLNKLASAQGIVVLNINELAQHIRVNYLPGEIVSLEVIQKGNDKQQGVGYFPDGTMVVVEHASADIGKRIEVELIRNLQTAAGRMVFAKKVTPPSSPKQTTKSRAQSTSKPQKQSGGRSPRRRDSESNLVELANK